jgi:SMI1/KNR4 family protein SUKH-1
LKILESLKPLDSDILKALEQYWGFGIPKDYREFLIKYNGGVPVPNCFSFKYDVEDGSCIHSFFGIKKDENHNLLMNIQLYQERIPANFLPIGDDSFGNLILLSVKGSDRGKIYFWDHEREVAEGEEPDYSNLTLIADSFNEFINSLRDVEE